MHTAPCRRLRLLSMLYTCLFGHVKGGNERVAGLSGSRSVLFVGSPVCARSCKESVLRSVCVSPGLSLTYSLTDASPVFLSLR